MRGPLIDPPPRRRPWHRRLEARAVAAILGVLFVAGAAALLGDRGPEIEAGATIVEVAATSEPATTPEPAFATATPLPEPPAAVSLAVPAEIALDPPQVGRGETSLLTVVQPGAVSGSVIFFDRHYPLLRDGEVLWTPLGAGLVAPLGEHVARIITRDATGATLESTEFRFTVVAVDRPVDYLELTEEQGAILTPEAAATEARLRAFEQFNLFDGRPAWDGLFVRPVDGIVTTEFGQGRSINGGPVGGFHSGMDIASAAGTPVAAAAPGRVSWVGPMPIRGNSVLVDHGAGVVTGYHHLQEVTVEAGQIVEAGQTIALMGSTGLSTGPHLHWEMTIYGVNVDPDTWTRQPFRPPAGE